MAKHSWASPAPGAWDISGAFFTLNEKKLIFFFNYPQSEGS